jgi:hypothetical protein
MCKLTKNENVQHTNNINALNIVLIRVFISSKQKMETVHRVNSISTTTNSTSITWQLAAIAVVGTTFVAVGNYFSDLTTDSSSTKTSGPVESQAEITSRAYFHVAIDNKPVGRIVTDCSWLMW